MATLLLSLKCKVSYDNENKVLCNKMGQTALYWMVSKMPDIVVLIFISIS
jgi:hypothetical protein